MTTLDENAPQNPTQPFTPEEEDKLARQIVEEMRQQQPGLSAELEQLRQQPLTVRLGFTLGQIIAGAEHELRAELEIPADEPLPTEVFELGIIKPLIWGLASVSQSRGLELETIADELTTAWTTPPDLEEQPEEETPTDDAAATRE